MKYSEWISTKNVVIAVTGAGAVFLLSKTLLAVLRSPPFSPEPVNVIRVAVEYHPIPSSRANLPGELQRVLQGLSPSLDDASKRITLQTITQCIYLKESEASLCTSDDIKLVASFLDDGDKVTQTEALNALKAFTGIWKFKVKIQEFVPQVLELVTSNVDNNLQVAGLKLLNGLHLPDHAHPLLRRLLPNLIDILLMANTLAKVQVLKLLSTLAQKEDLLYDIMNCRAPPDFLSLFQPSLPGNLLYEMLVFVERLSEGRLTPQYQSMQWQYNDLSFHEIIFGENSRLSDRLLALIIHPEEDVQIQACKVILSLQLNREESKVASGLPFGSSLSIYPLDSKSSHSPDSNLNNSPGVSFPSATTTTSHGRRSRENTGHSFFPLQVSENVSHSFHSLDSFHVNSLPLETDHLPNRPTDPFLPIPYCDDDEHDNL